MSNTSNVSTDTTNTKMLKEINKNDETNEKKTICTILQLPSVDGWFISDSYKDLRMVHYENNADMSIYGHIRGIVVSLNYKCVVASSYGYTPISVSSKLCPINGNLCLKDKDGHNHIFSLETVKIKRAFESVIIRTIWYDYEMIKMSHQKFNPKKSHWGDSPNFNDLYDICGGPSAESQFDITKRYSSTCNIWSAVHSSLLIATRQKVEAPYIVYLGSNEMNIQDFIQENRGRSRKKIKTTSMSEIGPDDIKKGHINFIATDEILGHITNTFIHSPEELNIDSANNYLQWGYYSEHPIEDIRQCTGEALILYHMEEGEVIDIVKVHSPSYDWRITLRGNNPNIVHQFYSLLNTVYPAIDDNKDIDAWNRLIKRYILFPLYDPISIIDFYNQSGYILALPMGEVSKDDYIDRDHRIQLLWINFLLSLPLHLQGSALSLLDDFKKNRTELITWLQMIEKQNKDLNNLIDYSDRIKSQDGIIIKSRTFARQRINNGTNYSRNGKLIPLPHLIANTIANLVKKENGTSLYSLIREMKLLLIKNCQDY
jgi:hypothetical protein